jgi:hypothetical protein
MLGFPLGGGLSLTQSNEIGISREALANALKTFELSMDSNQRSYAWDKQNVVELFQDLQKAIVDNEPEYFLGSIVVTRSDGHVVDGQQRLATTSILLAAMRDYCLENGEEGRASDIEGKYLFSRSFRTQEIMPRLSLSKRDHDFYTKRILSRPNDPARNTEPDKNRDSHRRILDAAQEARARVEQITSPFSKEQRAGKIADWLEYLETRARVIWISVPDDANAYTIFETLNDRGAELSISDLLKVSLFNVSDDRLAEAEARWDSMLGLLEANGGEKLTKTYVRHLWVAMHGPTRERELLSKIKAHLTGKQLAIDLANELAESAKLYSAILNPKHPTWKTEASKHLIADLDTLGVEQIRPLLLAIIKRFSDNEVEASLRSLVSWSVRFLIYGGLGGGTLERHYSLRAKDVWDGKITTTKALTDDIVSVLPGDVEFEAAFSVARASQPHLARFYLRALEIKKCGGDPCLIPSEDVEYVDLEHVLPENPGNNWGNVPPDVAKAYYRRIGNLALCSRPINGSIGNDSFPDKKPFLEQSDFKLTKSIASNFQEWGVAQIDERQKSLAALAVKTWPLRP